MEKKTYQHIVKVIELGLYGADKNGSIYSLLARCGRPRIIPRGCEPIKKIIKAAKNNNRKGYLRFVATCNGKRKNIYSHHFVWVFFNRKSNPDGMTINHIDGNKLNNSILNLELASRYDNIIHYVKTGKNPTMKLSFAEVKEIKHLLLSGKLTHERIAKRFNISRSHVSRIGRGQSYWYL